MNGFEMTSTAFAFSMNAFICIVAFVGMFYIRYMRRQYRQAMKMWNAGKWDGLEGQLRKLHKHFSVFRIGSETQGICDQLAFMAASLALLRGNGDVFERDCRAIGLSRTHSPHLFAMALHARARGEEQEAQQWREHYAACSKHLPQMDAVMAYLFEGENAVTPEQLQEALKGFRNPALWLLLEQNGLPAVHETAEPAAEPEPSFLREVVLPVMPPVSAKWERGLWYVACGVPTAYMLYIVVGYLLSVAGLLPPEATFMPVYFAEFQEWGATGLLPTLGKAFFNPFWVLLATVLVHYTVPKGRLISGLLVIWCGVDAIMLAAAHGSMAHYAHSCYAVYAVAEGVMAASQLLRIWLVYRSSRSAARRS